MSTSIARPPSPRRSLLPGGDFWRFRRDPLGFLTRLAREHGDIAYFRLGPQHAYFVNEPEAIRRILVADNDNFIKGRALQRAKRLLGEGLLTSEGALHRRQRRLAQPAFHRNRIAAYAEAMTACAADVSARWSAMNDGKEDGAEIDIAQEMNRLALAVVSRTLFSASTDEVADEVEEALTNLLALFQYLLLPYTELLERLPLPHVRRFNRARAQLDGVIYRIIAERRRDLARGIDRGDLLSMLLQARDEEANDDRGMSDEQVRDEAMTVFLAGHETTANALAWTWHFLAAHPEVERRLHDEIDSVLATPEGEPRLPTIDDYSRLAYVEQTFAEAMRLRPPAWAIGRLAVSGYETLGYRVPAGSLVLMSPFVMHRDRRYYERPEEFDPRRWTPEAKAARPAFSYFPFGGGARRCIGESFAWTEGVLVLATLASRWRFLPAPDHEAEMLPLVTLRPKRGIRGRIEARRLPTRSAAS